MKIGLYFGSFNPIHVGHLIIANYLLNETGLKKIWLIVSPQNPLKKNNSLLNEHDRLHLARLSVETDTRIMVSDIEFTLPRPSYTIQTLIYLHEKYPNQEFSLIMGSDSFKNLNKWKNHEKIIKGYQIYIYKRDGFDIDNSISANIEIVNAPILQISATYIRELIKAGKSIRYLVPENVREEIESRRLYKRKD